ncbi:hypothetical protein ACLVP8_10615, partial [Streptococcus pneumoniae]
TLKNAWTTSRQVNFFWVANFNLKFGSSELFKFFNENSIKVVDFETKKETLKDIYLNRSK